MDKHFGVEHEADLAQGQIICLWTPRPSMYFCNLQRMEIAWFSLKATLCTMINIEMASILDFVLGLLTYFLFGLIFFDTINTSAIGTDDLLPRKKPNWEDVNSI